MKVNKKTVSLTYFEFITLLYLDTDFTNMTENEFIAYTRSIDMLRNFKKQIEEGVKWKTF